MNLPVITDPFFYAVAIPAVLLMGISKSGFGSGFGSLAVPLMALSVSVPQAVAIMMPILIVLDVTGIAVFRAQVDKSLLKFMVPFGLLGTFLGTLSFKLLNPQAVAGIVGFSTLVFLAQKLVFPPQLDSAPPPRWLGGILISLSGFTSFIAHAGSPPLNAYVIPIKLSPMVYTATLAYFFFFINMAKWLPYAWLGLFDAVNFATALVLLPLTPIGVWSGIRIAKFIQPVQFYRVVYSGMFLTGCKLVWDAFN